MCILHLFVFLGEEKDIRLQCVILITSKESKESLSLSSRRPHDHQIEFYLDNANSPILRWSFLTATCLNGISTLQLSAVILLEANCPYRVRISGSFLWPANTQLPSDFAASCNLAPTKTLFTRVQEYFSLSHEWLVCTT